MVIRFSTVVVLTLWMLVSSVMADTKIDFEQFLQQGINYNPGTLIPTTSRLSDQLLSTHGVLFNSDAGYVAMVNLGTLGSPHATSGVMGIGGANSSDKLRYAAPITISFFDPANVTIKAVTNFVSIRGDLAGSGAYVSIEGFDVNGKLITSSMVKDINGVTLSISAEGIHSVKLQDYSSGSIGFDDLTFGNLKSTATCTPATYEAATGVITIPVLNIEGLSTPYQGKLKQAMVSLLFSVFGGITPSTVSSSCPASYSATTGKLLIPVIKASNPMPPKQDQCYNVGMTQFYNRFELDSINVIACP